LSYTRDLKTKSAPGRPRPSFDPYLYALSTRSAAPLYEYRPSETLRQRVTTL
jgi:hypothetical protein